MDYHDASHIDKTQNIVATVVSYGNTKGKIFVPPAKYILKAYNTHIICSQEDAKVKQKRMTS